MVSGTFAVNVLNYYNVDLSDNDVLDYNVFTPASKTVYESVMILDLSVKDFKQDMHTFADLVNFFEDNNIHAIPVHANLDDLQVGDIIHMKNTDYAFMVYMGRDNNSNILLEDIYNCYECSPETFNLLFTGKAILINHQPKTRSITFLGNGADVTDKLIGGSEHIGIHYKKGSKTQDIKDSYIINERINYIVRTFITANENSNLSSTQKWDLRAHKIWNWISGQGNYGTTHHIRYHNKKDFHYNTIHTMDRTLDWDGWYQGRGNCVEQARIIVLIARAAGFTARYVHPYGHVWAQVKVNGNWINMDNTKSYKYNYGEHDPIHKDTPTPNDINF
jgi:hypothetical protein